MEDLSISTVPSGDTLPSCVHQLLNAYSSGVIGRHQSLRVAIDVAAAACGDDDPLIDHVLLLHRPPQLLCQCLVACGPRQVHSSAACRGPDLRVGLCSEQRLDHVLVPTSCSLVQRGASIDCVWRSLVDLSRPSDQCIHGGHMSVSGGEMQGGLLLVIQQVHVDLLAVDRRLDAGSETLVRSDVEGCHAGGLLYFTACAKLQQAPHRSVLALGCSHVQRCEPCLVLHAVVASRRPE
mmetsp:Transcript_5585/g.16617  ORF Transcript_5585/g.16617 Transcript_5585/m.16617 type:complete len:236 (+) Transcript_5585:664-1371(+)